MYCQQESGVIGLLPSSRTLCFPLKSICSEFQLVYQHYLCTTSRRILCSKANGPGKVVPVCTLALLTTEARELLVKDSLGYMRGKILSQGGKKKLKTPKQQV